MRSLPRNGHGKFVNRRSVHALLYAAAAIAALILAVEGPVAVDGDGPADLPLYLLILLHAGWSVLLFLPARGFNRRRLSRFCLVPEFFLALTTLFFLFIYIYALNANMEYVERFIDDGTLRLALDTATERATAFARFAPFILVNLVGYILPRVTRPRLLTRVLAREAGGVPGRAIDGRSTADRADATADRADATADRADATADRADATADRADATADRADARRGAMLHYLSLWALPVVALSAFLQVIAFPSFLVLDGIAVFGWVALVPLFLLFRICSYRRSVFYGTFFGTLVTMLSNYWLATFNLVSLQFAVVLFFGFYLAFMIVALELHRTVRRFPVLVLPLAWTFFELARSSGFLGYPWTLVAHSQYANTALIQVSALTGVWGVSFLVLLVNSGLAESLWRFLSGERIEDFRPTRRVPTPLRPAASVLAVALTVWVAGGLALAFDSFRAEPQRSARVSLIQQNTDPRQAQYRTTLGILQRLTDEALADEPDMIAWSETAFVPNIRRWAAEDPPGALTPVVNEFLRYQESIGTWLLTGNDDYELIRTLDGREITRNGYNAAVLFDDKGSRRETYRKIRLVPFTEYFPYSDLLPGIYGILQEFDVYLWEPGRERTVFEHPKFTFATPICFEDVFPNEVRQFVRAGAEVIMNLTNDYWSLTEVQAKQHFAGAMFRAVENRRPMLRSTASGLTSHIDTHGRILATLPYYEEAWMTADVSLRNNPPTTIYTRLGDWFPVLSGLALVGLLLASRRTRQQ